MPRSRRLFRWRCRRTRRCCLTPGELAEAEAGGEVVVDHADGLHVGVQDGGPDEGEATALEVFAEGVGLGLVAGIGSVGLRRLIFGWPSTKRQQKLLKLPNSS